MIDYHFRLELRLGRAEPRNRGLFLELLAWTTNLVSRGFNEYPFKFFIFSGNLSLEHGDVGNSQGGGSEKTRRELRIK
jgi:hypothetical protein